MRKYIAEFIGTFALVFFGCATVIFMRTEVGLLGVAFAFGLSVVAMAYSIGHISGAHLNPAVSLGMLVAGRASLRDFVGYVIAQFIGGIAAAAVLYLIAEGKIGGYDVAANGFAQNGWGQYGVLSAFVFETAATFLFLTVILGATQNGASAAYAGLVIGLTLVAIHLAGIAVSGASVNPARSLGPALFAGSEALSQVWLYFVAPCFGAALAGYVFKAGVTSQIVATAQAANG
ncbi:MIP family channel protein [Bradyrhizobium sp. CER78]|uniref:MIP family channel protein n=1 Tax=Bradyrhizobium sp. CER78 TaxID=3039162 RepID=UPI0024472AD9|nr:MIP family channel protein [Bradyrhizobium sp. CER78]MDH2380834.1 MIP family channel protein [Bradyrhizobium sp. CER78]